MGQRDVNGLNLLRRLILAHQVHDGEKEEVQLLIHLYCTKNPNCSLSYAEWVRIIYKKMNILEWILIISETKCALDSPCLVT